MEPMLTTEEIREIESEAAHYPKREAVSIDALKIVQKHRGWVSDESLRDIAEHIGMRQRELLDHGLRANKGTSPAPHGRRAARNDRRQPLYAAADRLPRVLRPCPGTDSGRQ